MARILAIVALALAAVACNKKPEGETPAKPTETPAAAAADTKLDFPGTEQGAKDLLAKFLAPGADYAALSSQLRPEAADYKVVFPNAADATEAEAGYKEPWDTGAIRVMPKEGQTEVKVGFATGKELAEKTGQALDFPGGYAQIATKLAPDLTIYRFKFVEPGKDLGMAYDGLVYVNGKWRLFPKPWRVVKPAEVLVDAAVVPPPAVPAADGGVVPPTGDAPVPAPTGDAPVPAPAAPSPAGDAPAAPAPAVP